MIRLNVGGICPAIPAKGSVRFSLHPVSIDKEIAMTLEQLRIFVAVAERQHVTQAARALNLAQSATSHAIAALETRHDTKLFNRVGRGIELTRPAMFFWRARNLYWRGWKPPNSR